MDEETHSGTWEAPDIVSRKRERAWSTLTGNAHALGWRMPSEYSEEEKDLYMGKGGTEGRRSHRTLLPDMQGRSTGANLTARKST